MSPLASLTRPLLERLGRVATLTVVTIALVGGLLLGGCASGPPPIRHSSDAVLGSTPGSQTVATNVFHPEERDLSECRPAVERPGCGSKAKGGWRMTLVFAVLLTGLAVVISRVVISARARSRSVNHPSGDWN